MKKFVYYISLALPAIYMIAIWIMSSLPHNAVIELPDSQIDVIFKESLHLIEFAILYVLFVIPLAMRGKLTARTSLIVALVAAGYGVVDEIHQYFVPYRSATLIDVAKDWIGVLAAWAHVRYHYFHRKKSILNKLTSYFADDRV